MLRRKMLRGLKKNIAQYITIFLMILIGVFAYTGIEAYMLGMQKSADKYYKEYNLEDFNVYGNFTNEDIKKVKKIYNVSDVNAKLTLPSLGVEEGTTNKISINFIEENTVSKFYIKEGIEFDKDNNGIWLDYYYANLNNIKVGDTLEINYEKYKIKRKVVALITVPDMVYYTKSENEVFPNHATYGFIYLSVNEIPKELIEDALISSGIFTKEYFKKGIPVIYQDYISYNNLMVDVNKSKNVDLAKEQIKDKVDADAIIDIKDSISYKAYQSEIDEGKTYVGVFSGLFIFIAILSVITSMSRVVKKERKEIGTLKALGYSDMKVFIHYLSYGFYISLIASILGVIIGYFVLGNKFVEMEMQFYVIPEYRAYIHPSTFTMVLMTILAILITTYVSTRKILSKNVAETLRFEKPKVKKGSLNSTNNFLFRIMSFSTKWNLRDILRNKIRTFLGIVGVVGCMILLIVALGMNDTLNDYLRLEFNVINKYENKLNINQDITMDVYDNIIDKYGNKTSLTLPVEIVNKENNISNNIFINDTDGLVRTIDSKENTIDLKKNGVYITRNLAKKLNKKIGSTISWHIYGSNNYYESEIVGFNMDPQNQNITMTKDYYESLGLTYKADFVYTNLDITDEELADGIVSVQNISEVTSGLDNMLDTLQTMVYLMMVFACLLGVVIIYNIGLLSFSEKEYQFATLKVLGFSNFKIARVFIKQNMWISTLSILIGVPIGVYTLNYIFTNALSADYDFRAYVSNISMLTTACITFVLTLIVSILLSLKVRKIDMVTSLKGDE